MPRKNRGYATGTRVPVEGTQMEIMKLLRKEGAGQTGFVEKAGKATVYFSANNRQIRMSVVVPRGVVNGKTGNSEGEERRRWRALLFSVKAKFEAVRSEISTFETEFMPHTVMPDGHTVAEHMAPLVEEAYETGRMPKMLPALPPMEKGRD